MLATQYSQLHDYLTQVMGLSSQGGLPKITQNLVASRLAVSGAGVSLFLSQNTKQPRTMLANFKLSYPAEFNRWPLGVHKISRVVKACEVFYFLGFQPVVPKYISPIVPFQMPVKLELPTIQTIVKLPKPLPRPVEIPLPPVVVLPVVQAPPIQPRRIVVMQTRSPQAQVAISYRGQSTTDAKGLLFDHMRIQSTTQFPTVIVEPSLEEHTWRAMRNYLRDILHQHPAKLFFGEQNAYNSICPPYVEKCAEVGLVVIPGRVRSIEDEPVRLRHEYALIKGALNRGQPLLGICAGSWRLWEQLYIWTRYPDSLSVDAVELSKWHGRSNTLVDVTDHNYAGGMIRLDAQGVRTSYNVQIHDAVIAPDSLLQKVLKLGTDRMSVNSVHWKAVNSTMMPLNVMVNALSVENSGFARNTRQGNLMRPQNNTVEGFESILGTPVLGIQWHPEGYDANNNNANILKFMAQAGSAYAAKRRMLQQIVRA